MVRMSRSLKVGMRANGNGEHIDEFGGCTGEVIGPVWPNHPELEVNVQWKPSNLRYAYLQEDLDLVK